LIENIQLEADTRLQNLQKENLARLKGEQQVASTKVQAVKMELETQQMVEANTFAEKLEARNNDLQKAQNLITALEEQLALSNQFHEVDMHTAKMRIAQLQGEVDTSNLHVTRVDTEKIALEQKLSQTRAGAQKIQTELEELLNEHEALIDELKAQIETQKQDKTDMHDKFTKEATALLEAVACAERSAADANYNLEATAKRLGDVVNAERTAHQRTRNQSSQVELRLRRDLQAARQAAETYHEQKVMGDMAKKLQVERTRTLQQEMHGALQAVDIMSQERDLAEQRCEEVEWSSEMRCNRLVTDKLMAATTAKETLAKQSVARSFAEDQAQLAAARARQAEDEIVDLQETLTETRNKTRQLEKEKSEALSLLDTAHVKAEKMEEDQMTLIGYADAVASQLEYPEPLPELAVAEYA